MGKIERIKKLQKEQLWKKIADIFVLVALCLGISVIIIAIDNALNK